MSSGTERLSVHSWLFTKASVKQEGTPSETHGQLECKVEMPLGAGFYTRGHTTGVHHSWWEGVTATPEKLAFLGPHGSPGATSAFCPLDRKAHAAQDPKGPPTVTFLISRPLLAGQAHPGQGILAAHPSEWGQSGGSRLLE